MRPTIGLIAAVAAILIGTCADGAFARAGENQAVRANVSGGAVRSRAPGNMISAAVGRYQLAHNAALAGVEIVDTPEPSIASMALAESLGILFQQLNNAIVAFHNLLLARAGRPPIIPPTLVFPTTAPSDSQTDGTQTDLSGLDLGGLLDQLGGLSGNR